MAKPRLRTQLSPEDEAARLRQLAEAVHRAMLDFNARNPGQKAKIDATLYRLLLRDPSYIPKRSEPDAERREMKTPELFSIKAIADRLGTTVGSLLGEVGYAITEADRAIAKEFVGFLTRVFHLDEAGETARGPSKPNDNGGGGKLAPYPERTRAQPSPEFNVKPEEFDESGKTDYPLDFHGVEGEEWIEGGGAAQNDMTTVLHDVRVKKIKVVNVRDDSMTQFKRGLKLAVDVTKQDPAQVAEGHPSVAYTLPEGRTFIGYLYHDGPRTILENDAGESITIGDGYALLGPITQFVGMDIQKKMMRSARKKKGGTS